LAVAAPPRPRTGSGRLFVIVGLLLAVLAAGGVFVLGSINSSGVGVGGGTSIVVAARDVPFRGVLTADDLTTAKYSTVPPNAFTNVKDLSGKNLIAQVNISKGQPILSNMLASSPDQITGRASGFLQIPQGFVAVTMPTSELQGVAGYIQPNDYISIIATVSVQVFLGNQQQGQPKSVTKTVLTNVHVLRVGAASNQVSPVNGNQSSTTQSGANATSLTFVVTACDAEFLNWFRAIATLSYELESFKDYKPQDVTPNAACSSVDSAKGIGPALVNQRYGFTQLAG
jgi:Flp pilus assembly protein CpaB